MALPNEFPVARFHYVYILRSEAEPERHYTGITNDLRSRLRAHNEGSCEHTAKYRPWVLETAVVFRSQEKAIAFECNIKSHSGRAFATKHF